MAGRSSCPECGTILRIRDRSFVGRRVQCPECKTALRVDLANEEGGFVTRRLTASEAAHGESTRQGSNKPPDTKSSSALPLRSTLSQFIASPLTAAWMLAIAVSALIAVVTLSPKFWFAKTRTASVRSESVLTIDSIPTNTVPTIGPTSVSGDPTSVGTEIETPLVTDDDQGFASALEPANVDGPLTWPPPVNVIDMANEQPAAMLPVPVRIDINSKMAQPFLKYSQPNVRRRDLLEALQEQLGAPLRFDSQELGSAKLDETVSFELENTTMGGVIKTVADAAGWEIRVEDTGIRLRRKESTIEP